MQTEPQITFRGLEATPDATQRIHERIENLEQLFGRITSCRVTVDQPKQKGKKGHLYQVSVDLELPNGHVAVHRKPGDINAHESLNVAIRDSFDAARRQLEHHLRKTDKRQVKAHPDKLSGTVVDIIPDEGYGFIQTPGRGEVYFQRDSVTGEEWDKIAVGSTLHFSLMEGEKGFFAVNVSLTG